MTIFRWGYPMSRKIWTSIPDWAINLPDKAKTIEHLHTRVYCINCLRKAPLRYITGNFGPFCADCLDDCLAALLLLEE